MPDMPVTYAQKFLPLFQTYQEQYIERLETLVNIDSGSGQVEGINQVISHLEEWLRQLDFSVTLHPTPGSGNNLVARRRGRGRTRILLVGHVDTVYPPGSAHIRPFMIEDGIAYGPGVIDMKCGVLLILHAVRALQEIGCEDYGELCIVFNNDEEVGSTGSADLLREMARQTDVGLVLESTRAKEILTHSRKGNDKYVLEIHGVPAHSGAEPQKGRSAVVELAHKIVAIQNLHTVFYGVTFNITRLSSSEIMNIIPDRARCHISVRAFNARGLDQAAATLEQIAANHSVPDTHSYLTRIPGRLPYERTPEILHLLEIARQEGAALDIQISGESKGGVSDANLLMEAGLPTLDSLGPVGGGMHNLQREHLQLSSVPLRGALLAGLLQHLSLSGTTGEKLSS